MAKRILIVDDEPSVRLLLSEALQAEGIEVDVAVDGEAGLSLMRDGGYDLVLLDIMMPKLDGIGVLTELLDHPPKMHNKKIVLCTSLHDDPAVKEGLAKGATGFIVKSDLDPDTLIKKIQSLLSSSHLPNETVDRSDNR